MSESFDRIVMIMKAGELVFRPAKVIRIKNEGRYKKLFVKGLHSLLPDHIDRIVLRDGEKGRFESGEKANARCGFIDLRVFKVFSYEYH